MNTFEISVPLELILENTILASSKVQLSIMISP
ncbi:hypothetical protein M078_3955, partial [Bacteroides fragilis str. 2-F-2 